VQVSDDVLGDIDANAATVLVKTGGDQDDLLESGETWTYTLACSAPRRRARSRSTSTSTTTATISPVPRCRRRMKTRASGDAIAPTARLRLH
jgi:hypothetical protein